MMKILSNRNGFSLVEAIAACTLVVMVSGLMLSILLPALRVSSYNQAVTEAGFIGKSAGEYIKEELIFAKNIRLSMSKITDGTEYDFLIHTTGNGHLEGGSPDSPIVLFGEGFYYNFAVSYDIKEVTSSSLTLKITVTLDGDIKNISEFLITNINLQYSETIRSIEISEGVTYDELELSDYRNCYIYYRR